jgi:hypothetical protein
MTKAVPFAKTILHAEFEGEASSEALAIKQGRLRGQESSQAPFTDP